LHNYVVVIESAWISYRNRRIFKLLKHAIRAAENFMALDILRRVSPKEAGLLSDPCTQVKVRLRFGGACFPPLIFFKVFVCNRNGYGIKYFTGRRMIRPYSPAARSACNLMGARVFLNQLALDTIHHRAYGFTDEIDVSTLKDYMRYTSILDETPASLGGRENSWRQLTLEALPRHVMFYDVVDFIYNHHMSPALFHELPILLAPPVNQQLQLEHIRILSQFRSAPTTPASVSKLSKLLFPSLNQTGNISGSTSRHSRQARQRAIKMRSLYCERSHSDLPPMAGSSRHANHNVGVGGMVMAGGGRRHSVAYPTSVHETSQTAQTAHDPYGADEEDEARQLYEWTQTLSIEDFAMTPRLGSY
jgi:hypothetical protein